MMKALFILSLVCGFYFQECRADCMPMTISLDTLAPGVVKITSCRDFPPTCTVDTASAYKLMKALTDTFSRSSHVAVAHIESTFVTPVAGPWGSGESLYVAIDFVLKGAALGSALRCVHEFWEDSKSFGSMKNKKFIAFFDEIKPTGVPGLGEPSVCYDSLQGSRGYFIDAGRIANTGPNALLGVSVDYTDWLAAVSRVYRIGATTECTDGIPPECVSFIGGVVDTLLKSVHPVAAVIDTFGGTLTVDSSIVTNGTPVRGFFLSDTFFITQILGPSTATRESSHSPSRDLSSRRAGKPGTIVSMRGFSKHAGIPGAGTNRALVDFRGRAVPNASYDGNAGRSPSSGIYLKKAETR
jgi:hypothetical protein